MSGCDVNIKEGNTKTTPLMEASREGHLDVVLSLVQHVNIKLDAVDMNKKTAIDIAMTYEHYTVCLVLLKEAREKGFFVSQWWYVNRFF